MLFFCFVMTRYAFLLLCRRFHNYCIFWVSLLLKAVFNVLEHMEFAACIHCESHKIVIVSPKLLW